MLSDTFPNAVLLSFVNMFVVFSVLGVLGLLINFMAKAVPGKKVPPPEPVIGAKARGKTVAAVAAAVSAYLEAPQEAVFTRNEPGKGRWGAVGFSKATGPQRRRRNRFLGDQRG